MLGIAIAYGVKVFRPHEEAKEAKADYDAEAAYLASHAKSDDTIGVADPSPRELPAGSPLPEVTVPVRQPQRVRLGTYEDTDKK